MKNLLWIMINTGLCISVQAATNNCINPANAKLESSYGLGMSPASIPWSEICPKAGAGYHGDGLVVLADTNGARLRCVFQNLDGEVTREGLWWTSTAEASKGERFCVTATSIERRGAERQSVEHSAFPRAGTVSVEGQSARFTRPGLIEEYSVSMDGVRQDFLIEQKSPGEGELLVEVAVTGATVEPAAYGARLVLARAGRKIGYSRLRVTDAKGTELLAHIELAPNCLLHIPHPAIGMLVVVNDAGAVYPIRIDPTFSDANWLSMGGFPGADDEVDAAVADGSGNLYIGGKFTSVGQIPVNHIAKWDGSSWSALGSGVDDTVWCLAVSGSNLYAGGYFGTAGGTPANAIAKWDGNSWSALGSGLGGVFAFTPYAIAPAGADLYVAGNFTTAGGNPANYIAKWNGSSWSPLGSGLNNLVRSLLVSGSDLYVGGGFNTAGGIPATNIAKWDGSRWSALGSGMDGGVEALALSGTDLYAGGPFTMAGGSPANHIARWNGSDWTALGSGISGVTFGTPFVAALAASGSDVYAGGYFTNAGGSTANYIAKWNGNSWSALGSGMSISVWALSVSGGNLYAGGSFTTAGGNSACHVAKWNGTNWSALGSGMDNRVAALALSGSDLYAGGSFTITGGSASNYIAKWNGSSWSALGTGMNGPIHALAISATNVYAGGAFTTAGGTPANYIARWDGNSWSALGSGMNGGVLALAILGRDIYAGGTFFMSGGGFSGSIAKWDGSNWSPLGSGDNGYVYALAVLGSDLYVGGGFSMVEDSTATITANNIAKWDGTNWSALGSGLNGGALALAISGSQLYAGGTFTTAGGKISPYAARAYLERPALSILRASGDFTVSWPVFYETYALQQNPDAANPNGWINANYPQSTNGSIKSATVPMTPTNHFFRLIGN